MTSVRKRRQPLDIQFGQRVDLSTIDRLCTEWTGSTGSAKAVFAKIARRADYDKWDCYPAQRTIAKDAGVGVSTVIRAIRKLKTLGVLEVLSVGTGRDPTTYRVRFDRIAADIAGSTLATHTGQDDRCTPPPRRVSPVTVKGKQFQENKPEATAAAAEALAGFETTLATDELAEAVRNVCGSDSKAVVAAAMTDHVRAWYAIERVQANPDRYDNPSGWILMTIRDQYDVPDDYVTPPDRRAKRQVRSDAEATAREAKLVEQREAELRARTEADLDIRRMGFLARQPRDAVQAAVRLVSDRKDVPFNDVSADMVLSDERASSRHVRVLVAEELGFDSASTAPEASQAEPAPTADTHGHAAELTPSPPPPRPPACEDVLHPSACATSTQVYGKAFSTANGGWAAARDRNQQKHRQPWFVVTAGNT